MDEEILDLAAALGGVGAEDRERLGALCRGARRELDGMLRPGVSEERCGGSFQLAAAWMALADWYAGEKADGVESFSAGALTIRTGRGDSGRPLRRRALELMRAYLLDEGFAFQGVRG